MDLHAIARDLNTISAFLAENDFPENKLTRENVSAVLGSFPADVMVLLGNSVLGVSERAFAAMRSQVARGLLIAGGQGHSTHYLYEEVARHSQYRALATEGRSEAELLYEIATRFHKVDPANVVLETESTNCGENAEFALRTLRQTGMSADSVILVQDPTMQRRSCAAFRKAWQDAGLNLRIANAPMFVPRVTVESGRLHFLSRDVAGLWPMDRFISLVLGEIPRLRDDARGYGPSGRDFIVHVNIPQEVVLAHSRLQELFPDVKR